MDKIFKIILIILFLFSPVFLVNSKEIESVNRPVFSPSSEEMKLVNLIFGLVVSDCDDLDIKIRKNTIVYTISEPNLFWDKEYITRVDDIVNDKEDREEFGAFLYILIKRDFNEYSFINGEPYYDTSSIMQMRAKKDGKEIISDYRGYKVLTCGDNHLDINGENIFWNDVEINSNNGITDINIDNSVSISNIDSSSIIVNHQSDLSNFDIKVGSDNKDTFWSELKKYYIWPLLVLATVGFYTFIKAKIKKKKK